MNDEPADKAAKINKSGEDRRRPVVRLNSRNNLRLQAQLCIIENMTKDIEQSETLRRRMIELKRRISLRHGSDEEGQ